MGEQEENGATHNTANRDESEEASRLRGWKSRRRFGACSYHQH